MTTQTSAVTNAAVQVQDLVKRYRGTRAVNGVSLTVGRGVIGLLGPNGAGKTTLLRMVATVLAPDPGRLRLPGLDPTRPGDRLEIRCRLGYLPQSPGLYPGFTPFDLVDYVAVLKEHTDRRWRQQETRRVLEDVGLTDVMHKKIRTLSGGMRQRVALAAALLGDPDLLVLDEPASPARRRAHRFAVLLPVGLLLWAALLAAAHLPAPSWEAGWPFGPVTGPGRHRGRGRGVGTRRGEGRLGRRCADALVRPQPRRRRRRARRNRGLGPGRPTPGPSSRPR